MSVYAQLQIKDQQTDQRRTRCKSIVWLSLSIRRPERQHILTHDYESKKHRTETAVR